MLLCLRGLQVLRFTMKTHRNQHRAVLITMIYYSERMQTPNRKWKRPWGEVQWKLCSTTSPLPGVTQEALNYPSNKLWQHMWKTFCLGELRGSTPSILLWAGRGGILCLAPTKIPDFQRKSRWSVLTVLFVKFRHNHSYQLIDAIQDPQFPKASQKANLETRPFKDSCLELAMLTLFYTAT